MWRYSGIEVAELQLYPESLAKERISFALFVDSGMHSHGGPWETDENDKSEHFLFKNKIIITSVQFILTKSRHNFNINYNDLKINLVNTELTIKKISDEVKKKIHSFFDSDEKDDLKNEMSID